MEYIDWMGTNLDKYRTFSKELHDLDRIYCAKDVKCQMVPQTHRDSLTRKQYKHDAEYYRNRNNVLQMVRCGDFGLHTLEDLLRMHGMLFPKYERAGQFKIETSHLYEMSADGKEVVISTFANPEQRSVDLARAFREFDIAVGKEPELVPVFIVCLYMKILNVHPFMDGNGRTGRMLIQILLYQYGFRNAMDIPFEENFNRFNYICHQKCPRMKEYRYETEFEPMILFLLKLLRVSYTAFQ